MSTEDTTSDRGGALDVGDVLQGRYELLQELGEGGFAVVYKAFDETIERYVAIKVLHTDKMASEGEPAKLVRSRFLREARLAAQIRHSSIIEIYDFGVLEELDQPYMIMEFLEGKDLDDEIEEKGALVPERFLPLFIDALEALGEAHEKGVVHKDLKPANLFLTNPGTNKETLKVVDFGIAHADHKTEERLTKTGAMTGTPHYLPPEYLEEQEVLTEMDVYQMGLILIEALSGHRVVTAETVFQAVLKHVNRDLSIPPALLQGRLGTVIRRAIAYDPEMRYSTATEFAEALAKVDPAGVVNFNDPAAVKGMEPQSLAKIIESGAIQPLSEGEDSTFLDESAVAQTVISEELHASGAQAEIDNTHQEFGTTGSSTAVEGESSNANRETSKLASAEENAGSLSTEQVEAAFGSTWPLKLLVGLVGAVLLALGALVALMVIDGDDEEIVDEEPAIVDEGIPDDEDTAEVDAVAQAEDDEVDSDDEASHREEVEEVVTISLDSVPSGASVERMDGSTVGSTPTQVELERGSQKDLVLEHSGYHSKEIVVDSSEAGGDGVMIELEEESTEAEPVVEQPADPTPSPTPDPVAQPIQEEPEQEEVEEDEPEEDDGWALPGQDEPEEKEDDEPGGFELAQ